jgi:lipopolysaccharide transport system permease protein
VSVVTESCPETSAPQLPAKAQDELPVTIIQPRSGWQLIDLAELWRGRELLYFLVWRDVKVRYKQTVLGAAWAILQPLAQMAVLSVFFGRMVNLPSSDIPYPLFAFAGLLPWNFFSSAVSSASSSLVGNQSLLTKVYFPRLYVPASAIGVSAVDFGIAFSMLLVLMLYYGVGLSVSLLVAGLMILCLGLAALAIGTLLSALTVAYRDFRYVVPFMVQLWLFATPAVYMDSEVVGPRWQWVLPLNPAHGFILNFRRLALGEPLDGYSFAVSAAVTLVLLLLGVWYFRRVERTLADII